MCSTALETFVGKQVQSRTNKCKDNTPKIGDKIKEREKGRGGGHIKYQRHTRDHKAKYR